MDVDANTLPKLTVDVDVETELRFMAFRAPAWAQRHCEDEARARWAHAVQCGYVGYDDDGRRFARCVYFQCVLDLLEDVMTTPWTVDQARTLSYVTWQHPACSPSHDAIDILPRSEETTVEMEAAETEAPVLH